MKKYIYIMLSVVLAGIFASCSKDDPFDTYDGSATGGLLSSALDVSLSSQDGPRSLKNRNVRAKAPSVDLFKVAIYKKDASEPYVTYDYARMPEIVTLPVGQYYVKAYYGSNESAAWDAPYYEGTSEFFEIKKDEITETLEPIVCSIANVRVSIILTDNLKDAITGDYSVKVDVNDVGSLIFTPDRIENGESGYFRYVEGSSTLAATFTGEVDGVMASETKTDISVLPGRHYIITFKLYDAGEEEPGTIIPGAGSDSLVIVDSTVTEEDIITGDVITDDENVADDMRPSEGEGPGTGQPDPEEPDQPEQPGKGEKPNVWAESPIVLDQVNMIPNDENASFPVNIHVESVSDKGITTFLVEVKMENVGDDELIDMGLAPKMDLVNPDPDIIDQLQQLDFPVYVGGKKNVDFSITTFVPMLKALGEGTHEFKLTVGDEYGTVVKKIILSYKPN